MSEENVANTQAAVVAISLVNSALLERCRDMIGRLTTPRTFAAEVASFSRAVFDHIAEASFDDVDANEMMEGRELARRDVDAICVAWLRGKHAVDDGPMLN